MQEIEFVVDTKALETVRSTELSANWEEVEAQLSEMIAPYRTMVVTADSLPSAKSDRAKVRKLAKSLDDYRKTVKNAYMQPYNAFEERYKRIVCICNEASENIDTQVKHFEEQQKAEKISGLEVFFEKNVGNTSAYLTFQQVFNKRWENATFAFEDATEEIMSAIEKCRDGINAIHNLNSEFEYELLSEFAKSHDLALCMKKHSELTEIKRREDERKRMMEEARKREEIEREARRKAMEEAEAKRKAEQEAEMKKFIQNAPKPEEVELPTQKYTPEPEKIEESTISVSFRVTATRKQLFELREACDRIGIRIRRA